MSLIRIDYENARAQARQLEQSEQQCSQIAQSIQALRQQLAGVWAGEAADTYDQAAEVVPVQIKIESAVVQQAQARLRQQSGAMRAVAVNVSSVLNGLDMQIAATQQIRQSLEALSRRCTTEQTQLEAMTQMLLAASDRFTQTDQKLGHRARGLDEAADAIGAGLAATTLPAVALRGIDRQKCADELGKTFGLRTSETLCDGVKQAVVSKKKGWFSKLKDDVSDFGSAVKTSVSNVVSAAKESYQNHGTMYDVVEYGKAALKIGKGVVKIAGAVAAISTGVGIPIAICGIISAGNDIINAGTDIANIALDQYDEVGKTNYLKDLLKKNGGELGGMLGNRDAGEKFGELAYTGLDLVSFLDGADKMLKSFGKINTDLTGKTGYSFVWGKTSFDDVIGNEFKCYKPDEWLRSKFMDADSTANFVIEAAKNVKSFYKQSKKYVDEMLEFAFR